jgi:hypothetical protein
MNMNYVNVPLARRALPDIVPIVLRQAYRHVISGAIPRSLYERQIDRLTREELAPRGLKLEIEEPAPGMAQFVIKSDDVNGVKVLSCSLSDELLAAS